jgi:hypothetical protein
MNILLENLNWLAIFIASIVSFVIGAVWFGPKTFYPIWIKLLGREVPTERVQMSAGETALMFGGTYVGALVQIATLDVIITLAQVVSPGIGWGTGAIFGFLFSVGIGAFSSLSHRMFGQPDFKIYNSIKVWLIEVGQDVVCLTIAGAILGAFAA